MITVQQHLLEQQRQHVADASGELSWFFSALTLATKMIEERVRCAGLNGIDAVQDVQSVNVHGEVQERLDIYANQVITQFLSTRACVAAVVSEENQQPIVLEGTPGAKYIVLFDPLDGSSNVKSNVGVGTIFSVLRREDGLSPLDAILQPGRQQILAGYVLYGPSTILVYSAGNGVHAFTLHPGFGAYLLTKENLRIPTQGKYYSVNEAYRDAFPQSFREYLNGLRGGTLGRNYASRYVGTLVADFHRTLIEGGIFLYPPTVDYPDGKLRLMYENNPIAYLAEQAGGIASTGRQRVLDVLPSSPHQRSPLIVGGVREMLAFENAMAQPWYLDEDLAAQTSVCERMNAAS